MPDVIHDPDEYKCKSVFFLGVGEGSHGYFLERMAALLRWKNDEEVAGKEKMEGEVISARRLKRASFQWTSIENPEHF